MQPESIVFFIDRSLGRRMMPEALLRGGARTVPGSGALERGARATPLYHKALLLESIKVLREAGELDGARLLESILKRWNASSG